MTQASISYHIRSLEKWLAAPLFERLPRSVQLTEIGRGYLPAIRRALDDLSLATTDLFGAASKRSISIQAPTAFAALWLAPRLHGFASAYPETEIRLQTVNWPTVGAEEDIDIDIRYGDGSWPDLTSELLLDEPAVAVCAPALAAGRAGDATAFTDLPLIHVLGTGDLWESFSRESGGKGLATRKLLKVDSSVVALEMAASGLGIALVLRCFASPYLASGRLVRPLTVEIATGQAHYLVASLQPRQTSREVAACLAWLRQEAGQAAG